MLNNTLSLPNTTSMIYWRNGAVGNANWMSAGSFGNIPTYWKNGSGVQLTGNIGQAYGIAPAPQ